MKKQKKSSILLPLLIINLFTYLIALVIPISINIIASEKAKQIQIINGEVDLNNIDISSEKIYLDGEWKFYPNKWIVTEKNELDLDEFNYLNPKNSYDKNIKYASYAITLKNFQANKKVTIDLSLARCSFRVFTNEKLCYETDGKVSKTESVRFYSLANTYELDNLEPSETTIVIEVSSQYTSGLQIVPIITSYALSKMYSDISMVISGIVFGLFVASFICFLAELILKKEAEITMFAFGFFLVIFSLFLFLPPGVSIICLSFSYNYELSYLIIFCLIEIIYIITSLSITRKFIKDEIYSKKFICYLPLMILIIFIVVAILLFILGLFDYYSKILLAVSNIIPILIIILILNAIIRKKYNNNYITMFLLILSAFTLGLSIIFFTYINAYQMKYLYVIGILFFSLFLSVFISYNYNRKKQREANINEINYLKETINQSNASILLSQIRPHFLYNTLNTIVYLCRTDPKKAEDAIISFSKYLRANMNSLDKKEVIPFVDELNHIRNYVKIEQLRFGNKLKVIYNLSFTDFNVPPLSVQPIIENAIKHGITKKADGGKLILSTKADNDNVYITIEDTGVGFNVEDTFSHYKSTSIGLHNITSRIKMMSNGSIDFDSEIGKGTTVNIIIPKEKKQ